jgi:peptidoglycan/xylan/chitin deacetylase (PgdA/CDA1 family)
VPAPVGVLTRLPGDGNQLALTVDDGVSSPVVAAFAQFCRDTGTRLTFFVNGVNPSWSDNAPALRPLSDSGQVQMANHTWSHPYLNRISLSAVHDQIARNADFLRNT